MATVTDLCRVPCPPQPTLHAEPLSLLSSLHTLQTKTHILQEGEVGVLSSSMQLRGRWRPWEAVWWDRGPVTWCTLSVSQRRHNGPTREAEASPRLRARFATECICCMATIGRPFNVHSVTKAIRMPLFCHLWTTFESPPCSATFVRLFWTCPYLYGDHGVHGNVWASCVRLLDDQDNYSTLFEPPTAIWAALWSHKGSTKVAGPV